MRNLIIASLLILAFSNHSAAADDKTSDPVYDPIAAYSERKIEGWLVRVNKKLDGVERKELREQTLKLLANHLYQIARAVPANALAKLRAIPIWVELAHPMHPCMCYHTSADWLKANGMNPAKAGGIELANCKTFLSWTHQQPWMVFHELAHGYHDQVLTFEHAGIKACYDAAKDAKIYESVLHINGRKVKHYALTNEREYFAEMSEAYFGTNDFYPFVRSELKDCDPRMYEMLEEVWGMKKKNGK